MTDASACGKDDYGRQAAFQRSVEVPGTVSANVISQVVQGQAQRAMVGNLLLLLLPT